MNERRGEDVRISELLVLTKQVHSAVFGNGKIGIKAEFEQLKGSIKVWKYIAGGGGITAVFVFIMQIIKFFK